MEWPGPLVSSAYDSQNNLTKQSPWQQRGSGPSKTHQLVKLRKLDFGMTCLFDTYKISIKGKKIKTIKYPCIKDIGLLSQQ